MRTWFVFPVAIPLLAAGCIGLFAEEGEEVAPAGTPDGSEDSHEGERGEDGLQASFTSDCDGVDCNFDATNSSDPDGMIESYDWTFGDDENATGQYVTHTYNQTGTFTVELTVTNDDGETDTESKTGDITSDPTQAPADEEPEWQHENRTGTVSGTNAILVDASETEPFDVANGTQALALNLTADEDLDVCIQAPEEEDGECNAQEETDDENTTWGMDAPPDGEWTIELTAQGTGPQSVDYELVISQLVPPEAARNDTAEDDGDNTLATGRTWFGHEATTPPWEGGAASLSSFTASVEGILRPL